jgi:hypothetical protein
MLVEVIGNVPSLGAVPVTYAEPELSTAMAAICTAAPLVPYK